MKSARRLAVPLLALLGAMLAFDWGLRSFLPPARLEYRMEAATAYFLDFDAMYDTLGFRGNERWGDATVQWTWYQFPSIQLPLLPVDDLWLTFRVAHVLHDGYWDNIALSFNETPLELQRNGTVYAAFVPQTAFVDGRQTLAFQTPPTEHYNVPNPDSRDWRVSGMAVDWLRIVPAVSYHLRCQLLDDCFHEGFTDVQPGAASSRWTAGVATVAVPVPTNRPLTAHLRIAEAATPDALDGVQVRAGGEPLPLTFVALDDGSGTVVVIADVPPQRGPRLELEVEAGDDAPLPVGREGAETRVGLRVESVEVIVAPHDVFFYDFAGTQLDGLSELQWDGHTTFQWMAAPEARIVLPTWEGPASVEIGVLRAADDSQLDALTAAINGQPVTLERRTLLGRDVYSGEVELSGTADSEIVLRVPRLAQTDEGRRGLALDWIVLKK